MEIDLPEIDEEFKGNLEKYRVIVYHFDGLSLNAISEKVGKGKGTCSKWIKKFKKTGDVIQDCERSGRPHILNEELKESIYNIMKNDNKITLEELKQQLNKDFRVKIAKSTLSSHLSTIGQYKIPKNIPILSEKNKQKRLDYAKYHLQDKFSNVIFSDESRFEICRNTKKVFVIKGDNPATKCMSNPNYSLMVWGAISKKGKISFIVLKDNINADNYITTLENYLVSSANKVYGKGKWRFQQDNAPCHKAYKVKRWLEEQEIRLLEHPPQSPDLNPIENVWAIMKQEIEKENPRTKEELENLLYFYWEKMKNEVCERCINHLSETINKVILLNGDFTTN